MRGWIVSLLFLAAASAKATPAVAPGDYGDLLLGYDGASDVVTGYFLSGTGDNGEGGPQFTCAFICGERWRAPRPPSRPTFPPCLKSASPAR